MGVMHERLTLADWRQMAKTRLAAGSDQPLRDADTLLEHALGLTRAQLYTHSEQVVDKSQAEILEGLLERLARDEPLAYVTGEAEFWSLTLRVNPHVLIPRADTELLVELVLGALPTSGARILELGTGSGAIALALATERPDDTLVATDISQEALKVARNNQTLLAAGHRVDHVQFVHSDWFEALSGQTYDVIVSNPPYIDPQDAHVSPSVRQYEPARALFANAYGLADIAGIIDDAPSHLTDKGRVFVEHGWRQREPVAALYERRGFTDIQSHRDLNGHYRVTCARWRSDSEP